jgi:DNA polymerase (family 10)
VLDRDQIAARLREIASLLELQGASKFKVRAYARGARTLEAARAPIETLLDPAGPRKLTDLPGIGVALARQIEELHRTGRSELLDGLREGFPSGVLELAEVPGIGLHALRVLVDELGIGSLDDLRAAAKAGRLRTARGFDEERERKILEGLERYAERRPRRLLADGLRRADAIGRELGAIPGVVRIDLAGGLRRSLELVDAVDLVAVVGKAAAPARVADAIAAAPAFASVVARKVDRCDLRLPDGTRVGVDVAGLEAAGAKLLAATGAEAHVARLRERAAARGLTLEDDGLFDARGHRVAGASEEAIYRALGLAFVPAELREDSGEIALAERGEEIALVRLDDLRGFVHCHTTWSDGKHTIAEMARAAKERGASYLTITDHSASAHYARGLDAERLRRQWGEIEEAEATVGIRLLKGTEADILADGALDFPDAVAERLDVVIASIHQRHEQDEAAMTARLLRAMRAPVFKIWGHPLGRLVTSRPPIPCRVEEVLDALAASRGAIEINGDPHRLDLEPRWSRLARELRFVLSVDAHATGELDNARYAVGLARRAGLRCEDVLNTLAPDDFARAVRPLSP